MSLIGSSLPDRDGELKATGAAFFVGDMHLDGMLYGKVVWSDYPHAQIRGIDADHARRLTGVSAVLTARDVPGRNDFAMMPPRQPILAAERVRSRGEAVALVLAGDQETGAEALGLIRVDYQEMPGVFDPLQAMLPDAPLVHEGGNVLKYVRHEMGNVEEGFAQADVIVEGEYSTPTVEHCYLEPDVAVAVPDGTGRIVVSCPTQSPFEDRADIAAALDIPEESVRVVSSYVGGGFGGKAAGTAVHMLAALGAFCTGRPVKIVLTREESLRVSTKRHAYAMHYKTGAMKDGRLIAVEARLVADAGPYGGVSAHIVEQGVIFCCGPYAVPHVRLEGWGVHTNNVKGGAFRGLGINQGVFAMESQMDMLGRKLGIDPFELRLRNALEPGSRTVTGEVLRHSVPVKETLLRARSALRQTSPIRTDGKLGVGIACGYKNVGRGKGMTDEAGAILELTKEGKIMVRISTVDMGQGNRTAMAQLAAEGIGVSYDMVELTTGDTDLVPRSSAAVAQRQTFCAGNALVQASARFKEELLSYVARQYGIPRERLGIQGDRIVDTSGKGSLVTAAELGHFTAAEGETIRASYHYLAPKTYAITRDPGAALPADYRNYQTYSYSTQVAIVEVDAETGDVAVRKIIAAHDVGRAINPQKIEGQIEGACLMGQGYALSEQFIMDKGFSQTCSLSECRSPTTNDYSDIECLIVEDEEPGGPYGAKGVSEAATIPITPAIINAIYDATGVRITALPATPEKIRSLLKTAGRS